MKNQSIIVKNFVELATKLNRNSTLVFPLRVTFSPENGRILIEEENCKEECPSTLSLIEGDIYKRKFSF
jgi:hypothetical protein